MSKERLNQSRAINGVDLRKIFKLENWDVDRERGRGKAREGVDREGHWVSKVRKVKGESLRLKRTKDQKENPRGQIGGKDIKTESGGF